MYDKYEAHRLGHSRNQRKAVIEMGLTTEKELAYLSDKEIENLINESDFLMFFDEDDFAFLPKELEDKIIWIRR